MGQGGHSKLFPGVDGIHLSRDYLGGEGRVIVDNRKHLAALQEEKPHGSEESTPPLESEQTRPAAAAAPVRVTCRVTAPTAAAVSFRLPMEPEVSPRRSAGPGAQPHPARITFPGVRT